METRASHMLVGGFVLLLLMGLISFTVWIAKVELDQEFTDYDIYMNGSVFGLVKRSIVYYQGIPVGEVRDIELAPDDPSKVLIMIRLDSDVPVVQGSVARLEFMGFTGVAYIEISGGAPGGARLVPVAGNVRAVIPAETSSIQEVFQGAPDLINEAIATIKQVQKMLDDQNIDKVDAILANTVTISGNLARASNDLTTVVATATATLNEFKVAAADVAQLANTGNELLDGQGRELLAETTRTMAEATMLLERMDALVAANEGNITQFVATSLPEVSRMITDLRATARNLNKLMSRLEENPVGAILDPGKPKYDLKDRKSDKEDN